MEDWGYLGGPLEWVWVERQPQLLKDEVVEIVAGADAGVGGDSIMVLDILGVMGDAPRFEN